MIKCEHCEARAPNINDAVRYLNWIRTADSSFICPLHKEKLLKNVGVWMYDLVDEVKTFYVPVEEKDGSIGTMRVTLPKHTLVLTNTNGASIRISRYRHQGKWRFKDSRQAESCDESHVDTLLKRLGLAIDHFILITDFKSQERYWRKKKMYCFSE